MLISLVTPSLGGVSQRNQYHGAILTSGHIYSAQGSHFWSLLAMPLLSFCEDEGVDDGDGDGMGFPPTPIKTQKRKDYD